ncbi:MAG: hypothetical protein IJ041_08670 [Clostridia bacterium]|nr:hypothetical protein [Clostridia bacterium]
MGASQNHVADEHHFKHKEEKAAENLAPGDVAKAHHQIGDFGLPVAIDEGGPDIGGFPANGQPGLFDQVPQGQKEAADLSRDRAEEAADPVEKPLTLDSFRYSRSVYCFMSGLRSFKERPEPTQLAPAGCDGSESVQAEAALQPVLISS